MPLTEAEKVRVRHHLGFLNVAAAQTFVLGVPAAVEPQFIIEGAMNNVLESALPLLREHIVILDRIHGQKVENLENLAVSKLGDINLRQDEQEQLDNQYEYWGNSLCNLLGIVRNPFDKRGGSGINVPVG